MNDFPPFTPAKPKGGVAEEIKALNAAIPVEPEQPKTRRKRRTKAEMATGETPTTNTFDVYCSIVDALEYVDKKTRMAILKMLMDHHT